MMLTDSLVTADGWLDCGYVRTFCCPFLLFHFLTLIMCIYLTS
uniref:Uncharacterized protein n=1 Tax=Rhizophora mucronata TaxID=61149 RepID=A0A2P2PDE7_RHIMU